MYNGMMDPELMRLAQEQMSRIPPEELARIQQQMMSNPELVRLATEGMKNFKPEDFRRATEQLKHTRPEDMVEVSEKMAKATPEEIAAMKARADAQMSYELNAAQKLKQQGNQLHSREQYHEAAKTYLLAKNNLKEIPLSNGGTLQLQCSLNLMSCYLKTRQFEDCIKEGSEYTWYQVYVKAMKIELSTIKHDKAVRVLSYDPKNVKALYRRGQAYKELGNLEAAVSDLSKARESSPEDETIADVLRDANEKLMKEGGDRNVSQGVVIEEIFEEETQPRLSDNHRNSSVEYSVTQTVEMGECSQNVKGPGPDAPADSDFLQTFRDDPESIRLFQNYISNADPSTLEALGMRGMPPDMVKTATAMVSSMKPEELQKMFQVASSLSGQGPDGSRLGSKLPEVMSPDLVKTATDMISGMKPEELQDMFQTASSISGQGSDISRFGSKFPEMTPDMIKMASDTISKMPPTELQRMLNVASSMNANDTSSPTTTTDGVAQRSETGFQSSVAPTRGPRNTDDGVSVEAFHNSRLGQSSSTFPTSTADLQETMRNSMKDPAMQQMFTSMMKNMSPEMMANMSEQFGMKLSKEDAAKAQQAMASLSPEDLDRMMRWAEKAQRGVETVRKTKNWLLGKQGLILAILMLILAFILHQLGFIGG